ncbi:lipase family protein (macronuclear) [Tetrahymena thermophila SB210]|uniref:Lipase family protein n=1 Tax=Tetrahymena thermophila (strain SB210) TaxID=312017 RepID=I7M359_TETTS|nr:lipase family protein [Tetrahymena thermophila SB210]EAS02396.1 lipase family protein [Tetrahymena thermophila SB210]|eukprot:XP_001022641.1 lipase family protein [Tetrahymena thermophila SB210]
MGFSKSYSFIFAGLLLVAITVVLIAGNNSKIDLEEDSITRLKDIYFFSKVSYCDAQQINSWSCGIACMRHQNMAISQTVTTELQGQGYCGFVKDSQNIVISFRGSDNLRNWMSNLNCRKFNYQKCDKCNVHEGIYNIYSSFQNKLTECALNLIKQYPQASIIITGHSLGGALATLQAVDIKTQYPDYSIELVTFGSPRVGNQKFSDYANNLLKNNSVRITNKKDVIPHLPFKFFDFYHTGQEMWIVDEISFKTDCKQGEDQNCSASVKPNLSINDHLYYFGVYSGCTLVRGESTQEDVHSILDYLKSSCPVH